jgi:hypothetical protein
MSLKDKYVKYLYKPGNIKSKYNKIYHYHTRKTGGTSLNFSFLSTTAADPRDIYTKLVYSVDNRCLFKGKVFIGWNYSLIERTDYYYAWTHQAFHEIKIPKDNFTLTVVRNPAKRVFSFYNHLLNQKKDRLSLPTIAKEVKWLGSSFTNFLDNIPKKELLRQLYMFSKSYNIKEAYRSITNLSHIIFTEKFDDGIKELSNKLDIELRPLHIRKSKTTVVLSDSEKRTLNKLLEPEIQLYDMLVKSRQ